VYPFFQRVSTSAWRKRRSASAQVIHLFSRGRPERPDQNASDGARNLSASFNADRVPPYAGYVVGELVRAGHTVQLVEESTKWYLIEAVSNARISRLHRPDVESRRATFHWFSGALSGLIYVNAIDRDEQVVWTDKMLVALGFTPPERREADGNSFSYPIIYLGDGDPPEPPSSLGQPSVLLRQIPGPDRDFEFHGGLFRLAELEISTEKIVVRWRTIKPPIISEVFPEQMAALESDLEGLEDWAAVELRRKAERHLERLALYRFNLSDDLGTDYEAEGFRRGNRSGLIEGAQTFKPAPPRTAWTLTLGWHDLDIEISLLDEDD